MGFKLKSLFSSVTKPVAKALDPILPEATKKGLDKLDAATGNMLMDNAFGKPIDPASGGQAAPAAPAAPAITAEEAEGLSAKRLARLGRYFTSPLGVLSTASTGSQKIFS